jgi:hypothetical protein
MPKSVKSYLHYCKIPKFVSCSFTVSVETAAKIVQFSIMFEDLLSSLGNMLNMAMSLFEILKRARSKL